MYRSKRCRHTYMHRHTVFIAGQTEFIYLTETWHCPLLRKTLGSCNRRRKAILRPDATYFARPTPVLNQQRHAGAHFELCIRLTRNYHSVATLVETHPP